MSAGLLSAQNMTATLTAAEFRAIGSHISTVWQNGGTTKTADAGQIDWATVNWPGANGTDAGYEIRQFTDALQATAPLFIKLMWGRGAGANLIQLKVTIGTGSNGAGAITGVVMAETSFPLQTSNGVSTSADHMFYASADTWGFRVLHTRSTGTTVSTMLVFERTTDIARTPTIDGIKWANLNGSSGQTRYLPRTGSLPAIETSAHVVMGNQQTSGLRANGDKTAYPIFAIGIGEVTMPFLGCAAVYNSDFTAFNTYPISLLGTSQTMVVVNTTGSFGGTVFSGGPGNTIAMPVMRYV